MMNLDVEESRVGKGSVGIVSAIHALIEGIESEGTLIIRESIEREKRFEKREHHLTLKGVGEKKGKKVTKVCVG